MAGHLSFVTPLAPVVAGGLATITVIAQADDSLTQSPRGQSVSKLARPAKASPSDAPIGGFLDRRHVRCVPTAMIDFLVPLGNDHALGLRLRVVAALKGTTRTGRCIAARRFRWQTVTPTIRRKRKLRKGNVRIPEEQGGKDWDTHNLKGKRSATAPGNPVSRDDPSG